jgi:Fe-S cluster assembly protein SufD
MNRDASLNWYKVSQGGGESTYVSRIKIIQLEKSKSKKFNFFFKGRRFDNNIEVNLLKKESVSKVYSISNCRGFMEVNNFVKVFHKGERSVSYHLFKGIYDDNSRGVFHGIIHVDKNGNESKSSQYSKNLVLSNNSKIKISPELKIYNDNIVCNHGVTSSNLDKSMVFYLKSRGLGLRNIRNILVYAFMYEIFGFIDDNKVFLYLIKILNIRN